jgi:hypothetical protein
VSYFSLPNGMTLLMGVGLKVSPDESKWAGSVRRPRVSDDLPSPSDLR